jgi:aminoglycoside phosphotransferase family enzyme
VGPFAELWTRFYDGYLARTHDRELLEVIPPYLVWRALVVASPVWYPHYSTVGVEPGRRAGLDDRVRRALFRFIDRVLDVERLEPITVGRLLASTAPLEAEVER